MLPALKTGKAVREHWFETMSARVLKNHEFSNAFTMDAQIEPNTGRIMSFHMVIIQSTFKEK
jgi:hypothetical protein